MLIFLGEFYPSVGYIDEIIYLFCTNNLVIDKQHLDEEEFLDVIKMPIIAFGKMICNNKIKDGKTIAAYYLHKTLINKSI